MCMCVCVCVCRFAAGNVLPGPKKRGQGVKEWRFVRVMRASSSSSGIWGDCYKQENRGGNTLEVE